MSAFQEELVKYRNSLKDLTFNSKPIISMLTIVADDLSGFPGGPEGVVDIICQHLRTVDTNLKLIVLYLVDSIVKNCKGDFVPLFETKLVSIFKHVFESGDETTRAALYKLRKTWIGIFSADRLNAIDTVAQSIDPAWPSIPNSAPPVKRKKEISESTSSGVSSDSSISPSTPRRKQAIKPSLTVTDFKPSAPVSTTTTTSTTLPSSSSTTVTKKSTLSSKSINSLGTQDRDYRKGRSKRPVDLATVPPPVPLITSIPSQVNIGVPLQVPSQAPLPAPLPSATISNFVTSLSHQQSPSSIIKPPESLPQLSQDIGQQYVQVDGRTVKLFFLDENTSIVLMKVSPHLSLDELIKINPYELEPRLIMFEGKPTKVYIDSDKNGSKEFVLLDFNCQQQTFFHGEHAQRIKLGGPCREIILNGEHYQAAFGGPPIEVKFVGDPNTTHTLRLSGPPPRVKISEDLRMDLWDQYVAKIASPTLAGPVPINSTLVPAIASVVSSPLTASGISSSPLISAVPTALPSAVPVPINTAPIPSAVVAPITLPTLPLQTPIPPPTEQVNLGDLVGKLMAAGLMVSKSDPDPSSIAPTTDSIIGSSTSLKSSLLPTTTAPASTPSITLTSTVSRTDSPSFLSRENGISSLNEIETEPLLLETKSLKAEHPKVIADLINGTQCPNCSLRFEVGDSSKRYAYSVHLDWHFRLNRQERKESKSKSAAVRRWFCSLDLWVSFKEITDETDPTDLDAKKDDDDEDKEKKISTVSAYEDEALNECAVCKEKFETNWNEDEEEWQLLNAVKGTDEDKVYHPLCLEDLLKQREEPEPMETETKEEKPEISSEIKTEIDTETVGEDDPEVAVKMEEADAEENSEKSSESADDNKENEEATMNNNESETVNESVNEIDEDDLMIDKEYILHSPESRGEIEVSVCTIC